MFSTQIAVLCSPGSVHLPQAFVEQRLRLRTAPRISFSSTAG